MAMGPRADVDRRGLLHLGMAGLAALGGPAQAQALEDREKPSPPGQGRPTRFQVACMTLPYARFPLGRALRGIRSAGFRYVAWGTTHREEGHDRPVPVLAADAAPATARDLGRRCRDLGLEPVLMFSGVYPDADNAVAVLKNRIRQAAAAGVGQVLTFGHTGGTRRQLWVDRLKELGPLARDHGVLIVIKQHGGDTGTGAACAGIVRAVADEGIKVCYDAGNVMDYTRGQVDPLEDIVRCAGKVRSLCIKDHRLVPRGLDQDCGPGLGQIDHYRLLNAVAFTGHVLPLCCENLFAPGLGTPARPEGVDALARRAREFLDLVIGALQRP